MLASTRNAWVVRSDYLKDNHPDIEIIGPFENKDTGELEFSFTQDMLTRHPDLGAVQVVAGVPSGAAQAIQDQGLTGEVGVVGFDHTPENAAYLPSGKIDYALFRCRAALPLCPMADGLEMPEPDLLEIKKLQMSFGPNKVFKDINLTISSGEIVALLGENGAGKSTLVNIVAGGLWQTGGTLKPDGETVEFSHPRQALERGIALIHQELSLNRSLSVQEKNS